MNFLFFHSLYSLNFNSDGWEFESRRDVLIRRSIWGVSQDGACQVNGNGGIRGKQSWWSGGVRISWYCAVIGSGEGGSYLLTVKRVKARQVGARRKNKSNVREITRLGNRVFYVFENWPTVSCIIFVLRGKILVDRKDRSQRCEDTRNLRKVLFSKRTKWLWIREEFFFLFI